VSTEGRLVDLTAYLDTYLRVRETPDEPNAQNGLQVENSGTIQRIVAAVDASQQTIDGTEAGSLLVVHHGLFWDGNPRLTGRHYRRLKALLDRDLALYAAHIPLDVHPVEVLRADPELEALAQRAVVARLEREAILVAVQALRPRVGVV